MRDQLPVILFLVPFATAICLPMVGLKAHGWCRPMALVSLLVMFVLAVGNLLLVLKHGEQSYGFAGWSASASPPLGIVWVNDALASVMMVTISFLASLCLLYSGPLSPATEKPRIVPYYALILLLISALTGIVFSGDIFNVFVFLEVAALSAYALVALAGGRALIAAFRYLILGTLGSTFYLLGVVFFYATTGTLNMEDICQQFTKNPELLHSKAVVGGMAFLFLGLGIKMALFPLHAWLPGAYTHAPDAISPLLAGLMTKVALYGCVRVLFWGLAAGAQTEQLPALTLLGGLGMVAALAGSLLALAQQELKRMFAYGGISHIGLILIGVSQTNQTAFAGSMFYLMNDAIRSVLHRGCSHPAPWSADCRRSVTLETDTLAGDGVHSLGIEHDWHPAHWRILREMAYHPGLPRSGELSGGHRNHGLHLADDGLFPTVVPQHVRSP